MMKPKIVLIFTVTIFSVAVMISCARTRNVAKVNIKAEKESLVPNPNVHFPFDKVEMFVKEMQLLDENAGWMRKNKDAVVILEGHCDEHGQSDYNIELGDRRARTVKSHLIERGVPHDRIIMVVSYGDTKPIDPEHNYDAWKMNRRVEFIMR